MLFVFEDNSSGISENVFFNEIPLILSNNLIDYGNKFKNISVVDLVLSDNRKIINAILFNNKYLVANLRIVQKGQIARDRVSDFSISLRPTIFKTFNFRTIDIIDITESRIEINANEYSNLETRLLV